MDKGLHRIKNNLINSNNKEKYIGSLVHNTSQSRKLYIKKNYKLLNINHNACLILIHWELQLHKEEAYGNFMNQL